MSERAITDPGALGWVETSPGFWEFSKAGGGIEEAPEDSKQYARQDAAWSEVVIPEVPEFVETDPTVPSHVKAITTTNISNWNTAYDEATEANGWGNHADAGYYKAGDDISAGSVVTDGDLSVTSSTNTATINLNNSVGSYEIANNEFGSIAIKYNGDERFVLASNGDVYLYGKLFLNGEEIGGGAEYTAGNGITINGNEIKMSGSYSGTFTANTVVGSG